MDKLSIRDKNKIIAEYTGWTHIEESGYMIPEPPYIGYPPTNPMIGHKIHIPDYHSDERYIIYAVRISKIDLNVYTKNLASIVLGYSSSVDPRLNYSEAARLAMALAKDRTDAFVITLGHYNV
jgi:hypothetical protein